MPFHGVTIGQVFWAVAVNDQRPDIPPECPAAYAELMQACWAKEPSERPGFPSIVRTLLGMVKETRAAQPPRVLRQVASHPPPAARHVSRDSGVDESRLTASAVP